MKLKQALQECNRSENDKAAWMFPLHGFFKDHIVVEEYTVLRVRNGFYHLRQWKSSLTIIGESMEDLEAAIAKLIFPWQRKKWKAILESQDWNSYGEFGPVESCPYRAKPENFIPRREKHGTV